jgi:hypothetical protein
MTDTTPDCAQRSDVMSTDEDQLDLNADHDIAALEHQVLQLVSANGDALAINTKLRAAILKISDSRDDLVQREARSSKVVRSVIAEMAAKDQLDRTPTDPLAQANVTNATRTRKRLVSEWLAFIGATP